MADASRTSRLGDSPQPKQSKKPSLLQRLLRKLESKRRKLKREDPNIYPIF